MASPLSRFMDSVYESIKANRLVPDEKSGVCAGLLTPKETTLFDAIRAAASKMDSEMKKVGSA